MKTNRNFEVTRITSPLKKTIKPPASFAGPVPTPPAPAGNPRRTTLKRPATVGTQVLISVSSLMRTLRSKTPHLVACVKPNELKQPRILESALVLHQIKYLG